MLNSINDIKTTDSFSFLVLCLCILGPQPLIQTCRVCVYMCFYRCIENDQEEKIPRFEDEECKHIPQIYTYSNSLIKPFQR